jgi:hypothetical protein
VGGGKLLLRSGSDQIESPRDRQSSDDPPADTAPNKARRHPRRVADHILNAFHQTCDQRNLEVAEQLLAVLARVIAGRRHQPTAPDRRDKECLIAAYERLWQLRHPDIAGGSDAPL